MKVLRAGAKLSAASGFAAPAKMGADAAERFRVVLVADARNARSASRVVAITPA